MSPNVNQQHAQILFGNMVRLCQHILIGIYIYICIYLTFIKQDDEIWLENMTGLDEDTSSDLNRKHDQH